MQCHSSSERHHYSTRALKYATRDMIFFAVEKSVPDAGRWRSGLLVIAHVNNETTADAFFLFDKCDREKKIVVIFLYCSELSRKIWR